MAEQITPTSGLAPLTVRTNLDRVAVDIGTDGATLYSETLYPAGGLLVFSEFRRLAEEDMLSRGRAVASYTATVNGHPQSFLCAYSSRRHPGDFAARLASSFLTTADARRMPPGEDIVLHLYSEEAPESPALTVTALTAGGRCAAVSPELYIPVRRVETLGPGVWRVAVPTEALADAVRASLPGMERLATVTVAVGDRTALFAVDPAMTAGTCRRFDFRNAFNIPDTLWLPCAEEAVSEPEWSEATVGGESVAYDREENESRKVTTASLTYAEADLLRQMLVSPSAAVRGRSGGVWSEPDGTVLTEDVKFSIPLAGEEPPSATFSYRLAGGPETLPAAGDDGIFTEEFTNHFS